MSFTWYRKHEKAFLWATIAFCVLILGLFAGFGDLQAMLERRQMGTAAAFVVPATGERVELDPGDVQRTWRRIGRLSMGRQEVSVDRVYAHLMLVEDAKAARIEIAPEELGVEIASALTGGNPETLTPADYQRFWRDQAGFASAREFEDFYGELLLVQRYQDLEAKAARVVTLDDVYTLWRLDNERFDVDVVTVPDAPEDEIGEPTEEQLRELWDGMSEVMREAAYREPQRIDVAFGWIALDDDLSGLPEDVLAELPEVDDVDVQSRFLAVKANRYPELDEPTDEIREALRTELRVIHLTQAARQAFDAGESKELDDFRAVVEAHGMTFADPAEPLGPDEMADLEPIGQEFLHAILGNVAVGAAQEIYPFAQADHVGVILKQDQVDARPQTFEEATEALTERWRSEQAQQPGIAFREALREAAAALPDVADTIASLEAEAVAAAEARAADDPDADLEELKAFELELVQPNIDTAIAFAESRVWDEVLVAHGLGPRRLTGLTPSDRRAPADEEDEEVDDLERFVRSHAAVYGLAVDGITDRLYDAGGERSVVVRVVSRSFPDRDEMRDDLEGMRRARQQLAAEREADRRRAFEPEQLKISHRFEPAVPPEDESADA